MAADALERTTTLTMAVAIKARSRFDMRGQSFKLSIACNDAAVDRPTGRAFVIELWQPKGFNVARVARAMIPAIGPGGKTLGLMVR
jgi:hypothetical protein